MEHIIPTPPSISFNHGGNSVISNPPSVLTHNSATGTANLCHSSVGSVVSTPHRGNGNDLSCSVQAADGGVSNVRSVNDVLSVSTNTSDESVLRSATAPSPHCGKEGGQSHIINLVAECVPGLLDRDLGNSFDGFCLKYYSSCKRSNMCSSCCTGWILLLFEGSPALSLSRKGAVVHAVAK